MKAVLLYRQHSESERLGRNFAGDFERKTGKPLEVIEADSREGMEVARLYDIVAYPAIIAMANDGKMLQLWQGENLPLMDELSFYVNS